LGLARSRYVHEREIPLPKASQALRTRSTLGATLVILFFPAIAVLVTINLDWKVGWAWTLLAAGLLVYQHRVRLKFLKRGQLGDPRWARDWSPETDPAHAYRGVFQLQRGNYEEARALLQQALESNPGDQSTLYNLACVEARVGQREAAITHLLGALSGNERLLKHAQKDADLAPIRDDPRFPR
jgi:tetratricopeptide (TPR) repeat protein